MLTKLLGLNTEELRALLRDEGLPSYRGKQIAEWVYRQGARSVNEMTNLPDTLRARLGEKYEAGRSQTVAVHRSRDGTAKLLLEMSDGARVETVGLPYEDRFSCCVSTQVGCRTGCVFCATGLSGFTRDLTAGEIVDQVLTVQEAARTEPPQDGPLLRCAPFLRSAPSRESCGKSLRRESSTRVRQVEKANIDHVTFMGMGEPLLNYAETLKAVHLLNSELGIAMRNLSVSTAGYVPGIRKLALEKLQITLAVSLHAPDDVLRKQLVPGMTQWSVSELIDACREYVEQTGRRVTFEYCLLDGVNDGFTEARALAALLRGLNCHVNLIPYNPVPALEFDASPQKSVQAFRDVLEDAGIQVTQRVQRGSDIDAACGQLRRRAAE